jgi:hypothetical protein
MAAVAALRHSQSARSKGNVNVGKEPMSFHLAFILGSDYILPDGSDSVDVLRLPLTTVSDEGKSSKENLTDTKMEFWTKKFTSTSQSSHSQHECEKAWQDRLLVITEKRIFILTEKEVTNNRIKKRKSFTLSPNLSSVNMDSSVSRSSNMDINGVRSTVSVCLEIVDSIPMEEIISVSLDMDSNPGMWDYDSRDADRRNSQSDLLATERSLRQSRPKTDEDSSEPMLRILTKPNKFNCGEPYYFLLPKQDYPCLDTSQNTMPLRTRSDAEALANHLAALAGRRHTEHARENRFLRLQKLLRHGWNSMPFNLLVLALIVSNFAFTVMQLENTDPDMQPFYEDVDLAYTVIFTVGAPSSRARCAQSARTHMRKIAHASDRGVVELHAARGHHGSVGGGRGGVAAELCSN